MAPDRWQHLQNLYFRALDLPVDRRRLFLDTICQDDPAMGQEVESLLQCEGKIELFLETSPIDALPDISEFASSIDETEELDEFIGRIIDDRYVITRRVGSGGMGVVYRADHRLLGTPVAIKRLGAEIRDRKEHRQRAVEEARRASKLDHENIAKVKDVVEESNEVFLVLEFIDGQTLRTDIDHPAGIDDFLDIATQCASALAAAHEKRIAHLDIKPANIMLTASRRVKICDFGVARQLPSPDGAGAGEETRWTFGGTPAYMAPEVLESNRFDVGADVFSLGVVFYELLSGTHPFRSTDLRATTNRILKENPAPLQETRRKLPTPLIRLVDRMLSKDPDSRVTAAQTLQELRMIQRHRGALKALRRAPRELVPLIRRKPVLTLSLVAVVVLAIAGVAYVRPTFRSAVLPGKKDVAVLQFGVNEDSQERRLYARGVSEVLTRRLMQLTAVPNLHVLLPASMRQESIDTLEKARAEGATLALEGTFHFQGDQVMLEYSWTRTADGKPLRAKSVKGSWADRITYQEDVVRAVLAELQAELAPGPGFGTSSQKAASLFVEGLGALSEYHDPKNVDTAVERFKEAVRLDPKYAAAQAALGQAYWHKYGATQDRSFLEASLAACQLANDLAPENSDAQVCLGRVYQARGDHPLAIEKYKLAIQYSAANDNAFLSLGKVLEEDGRFGEAEKEYQRAIDLRPDYWAPQSWIAGFYCAQQKYIEALEHYKAALDLSPSNAQVLYSMACPFAALGQYEMAVNVLEESAKLRPWKIPYSNLGVVYLRWRHYENALTQLEKAVELATKDGGDYRITGSLARVYSLTGKKDKAREMYELAIKQGNRKLEVNPVDDEVQILLGRYYAMLQKRTEAESALDVALKRKPDDPHYLLIAATAYVALNERQRALAYMKRAVEHNYGSVQISAEPELDVLKEEPKFKELMSSVAPSR